MELFILAMLHDSFNTPTDMCWAKIWCSRLSLIEVERKMMGLNCYKVPQTDTSVKFRLFSTLPFSSASPHEGVMSPWALTSVVFFNTFFSLALDRIESLNTFSIELIVPSTHLLNALESTNHWTCTCVKVNAYFPHVFPDRDLLTPFKRQHL